MYLGVDFPKAGGTRQEAEGRRQEAGGRRLQGKKACTVSFLSFFQALGNCRRVALDSKLIDAAYIYVYLPTNSKTLTSRSAQAGIEANRYGSPTY